MRKLTDIFTPQDHQRMIDRLTANLDPSFPISYERAIKKISWHTAQYLEKTGMLPS